MKIFALAVTSLLVAACGSKTEPATPAKPTAVEPSKAEPAADPAKAEPAADPAKAEPAKADPAVAEPAKVEPAKVEAPPIAELAGLFKCKAPADGAAPARDAADPWALPYEVKGCPAVPAPFGTVTFGMDRAAAAAALGPDAKVPETGSAYIYLGERPFKQQLAIRFDDAGKVDKLVHKIDAKGLEVLKAAWGEPLSVKSMSETNLIWYNPETKLRVHAEPTKWSRANAATKEDEEIEAYHVYFASYLPLADILGEGGVIARGLLGKTADELRTLVPEGFEQQTEAEAQAKLDALGLDADTKAKAAALGAADAKVSLKLAPMETVEHHTLVQPSWTDDGKVESYSMSLGETEGATRDELLAQVAAVLGKPTAVTKKDESFEYAFAGPGGSVVTVKPSFRNDGWRLEVSAPAP